MSGDDRARHNRIGIAWMVLGMSAFIGNDAIMKAVGERLPAAQMIVVRGVMAIVVILLVAARMGALGRIRDVARGWVLLRASCEGLGTVLYLAALFHLPLANITAINLSSPLFIVVLAKVFLNERVDRARWLAIGLGFAGVLLVVQPRADGFSVYAWVCLLATLIYAVRDLLTRKISSATPSILVTLATAGVVWLMAGLVMAFQGWTPMQGRDLGWLALASLLLSTGYYSVIAAMRHGEMTVIAPFRYVGLLWAVLIGYVVCRTRWAGAASRC
ncbi:MAG: EamA family transporter [Alphaproteobacteria bacterium PA3]|nr:MAG: EamA family transporter [Alphaproteobacteria bacterium PA3]